MMSDKTMPNEILYIRDFELTGDIKKIILNNGLNHDNEEYTLVHNNPDYHVIKKSDVDGDVYMMDILQVLERIEHACSYPAYLSTDYSFDGDIEILRNALIAQSATDTVTIPRKVLEDVMDSLEQADNYDIDWAKGTGENMQVMYDQIYIALKKLKPINEVLNYKEGDDDRG